MMRFVSRRMKCGMVGVCALFLIGWAAGCAPAFKETYYVGVFDRKRPEVPMQFYRFRMTGGTDFGSKLKFQSGWYPAKAVEAFLGEDRNIGGDHYRDESSITEVLGPEGSVGLLRNQRLLVFMATDPSPMTNAIASFSQSINTQVTAAMMAANEKREKREAEKREQHKTQVQSALSLMENTIIANSGGDTVALLGTLRQIAFPTAVAGVGHAGGGQ